MTAKAEQTQATAKVVTDTRRPLNEPARKGEQVYPVKLRITWNRKRRYFNIPLDGATKSELKKIRTGNRLTDEQKDILNDIQAFETKAAQVIKALPQFSFDGFKKAYFVDHSAGINDVYAALQAYIDQLNKEGRTSTAVSYNCALNSLRGFQGSLSFDELTPDFLESYEDAMIEEGKTVNTIGIYLRSLRTVVNIAKYKGLISLDQYPFGKESHGKYQIPASQNVKKALTEEEIQLIKEFQPPLGSRAEKARDFWLFAYITNGLNVKDIAFLKWENVDFAANEIRFFRKKTERTTKGKAKEIPARLTDFTKTILGKYGTNPKPENYVFPILKPRMTPNEVYRKIQDFTKMINQGMKTVKTEVGIDKKVTTYSARHSHATILLKKGAPLAMISENLGHNNLKTTQSYLGSFDSETKQEYADMLY